MNNLKLVALRSFPFILSRFMSQKCCPKIQIKSKSQSVCDDMASSKQQKTPWQSMWDPTCTKAPCPMPQPFDAYHYRPSDKETRKYQKTWNDCPVIRLVEKALCTYPQFNVCEPEKRKIIPSRLGTYKCRKATECLIDKVPSKCTRIVLPGCRKITVRNPPKCAISTGPSGCGKYECPSPSYTECNKGDVNCKVDKECGCLHVRSITEVYCKIWSQGLFWCPRGKYC